MALLNLHFFGLLLLLSTHLDLFQSFLTFPKIVGSSYQVRRDLKVLGSRRDDDAFFGISDIEEYAKVSGLILNCTTTGPLLRIEAFPIGDTELIGYLTAFIRPLPFGLFHLDTIKVKNRRQNLGYLRKNWTIDGPGISFIMGSYALRWAYDRGCRKSQLLAVNDSPLMHAVLSRLYQSFGFKIVREVTEETISTGDRLIWGAIGTLMELDINQFFTEWTPKLRVLQEQADLYKIIRDKGVENKAVSEEVKVE